MSVTTELVQSSSTLAQTRAVAMAVAHVAEAGDLIGLVGALGAGKTQFVRGLAEGLEIDPGHVSSPTFVLMQEYEPAARANTAQTGPVLVHIDAYRLQSAEELATIGWGEQGEELRDGAVVAVEWADHVPEAMGRDWLEIILEHADPGRRVTLRPHGTWTAKMQALRRRLSN